jgi:hypothetical protein
MGQQTQHTYDALARVTQVSYLPNSQEDTCQRRAIGPHRLEGLIAASQITAAA